MTRDEHLRFCKKCTNRTLDTKKGLICKLTNEQADFEGNCPDFNEDETVKETVYLDMDNPRDNGGILKLEKEDLEEIKGYENLTYALLGGLGMVCVSALLWAMVTVSTGYQVGYMAVGVGLIIGFSTRFFGAGIDPKFGYVGAGFALLACLLGNLFSQIGFISEAESISPYEVLSLLDLNMIVALYSDTFSPMDILFYGIAIFEGYKFAFRKIEEEALVRKSFEPLANKLRFPLAIASVLITLGIAILFSQKTNGEITFHYESGELLSAGNMADGKEDGEWRYYHKNGVLSATANYTAGVQDGKWIWYDEGGNKIREGYYNMGLTHGVWINYYSTGVVQDSGNYVDNRRDGSWIARYENGLTMSSGDFTRDKESGFWTNYYENGKVSRKGNYKNGESIGVWKIWNEDGTRATEVEYNKEGKKRIINAWDNAQNQTVTDGNGVLKTYYENGQLERAGTVLEGLSTGVWETFYDDGSQKSILEFKGEEEYVLSAWNKEGEQTAENGVGELVDYYYSGEKLQQGPILNGKREGLWMMYSSETGSVIAKLNFNHNKLEGTLMQYYETGELRASGEMKNDERDGEWQWYYQNEQLESSVNYENGKKEGVQQFWSELGEETKQEVYENGKLVSETTQP